MSLVLYNQCRSGPSHRVRIALALKGLAYTYVAVNLRGGEQRGADFLARNRQGLVPALEVDGRVLTQSGAIIEWLDEAYPAPPLLPTRPMDRAIVRGMADVIGSDIQPLNNMRVQAHLRNQLAIDDRRVAQWVFRWIAEGFDALEETVARHGGKFCFGDTPTLADIYLVPQAGMAGRLGFDMTAYPRLSRIAERAAGHSAFMAASPSEQPDWS